MSATLPITLGSGTFLVSNQVFEQDGNVSMGQVLAGAGPYEMSVRQGVGLTYPSGTIQTMDFIGTVTTRNWSSYINQSTPYFHQGWAIKLSGVTSGGVGPGGAFGGGIQSG
jgi:hypothetical protein